MESKARLSFRPVQIEPEEVRHWASVPSRGVPPRAHRKTGSPEGTRIARDPTISAPPHSSTTADEGGGEPGADGTRTGPADLRSRQAGAVPAAQLHPPARARSARR